LAKAKNAAKTVTLQDKETERAEPVALDGLGVNHADGHVNGQNGAAALLDTTGRQVVTDMIDGGESAGEDLRRVTTEYNADNLRLMEGVEHVRHRPSMYIGDTGTAGLHHLMYEILDNSVDEVLAGHATEIWVTLNLDQTISVRDNGRGIPTGINTQTKMTGVELAMTKLNAGGKFGDGGYKVSGGLHGVGLSCVNFLSEWCEALVEQNGKKYKLRCERGIPKPKGLKELGPTDEHGTTLTYLADREIFGEYTYKPELFETRIRNTCYLNREATIHFHDKLSGAEPVTYHYERGIAELVDHLNENKEGIGSTIYLMKVRDNVQVEVALQYNQTYSETVLSFANNVHTKEGGTHLSGFRTALTRVINQYARKTGALKEKDVNLSGDDVREGLAAAISVRLQNPTFEAQTKIKLTNPEVDGVVNSVVGEGLTQFLEENPAVGKKIIDKALTAQRARDAARKAADLIKRQSSLENSNLPGKLADCTERDPKKCELFLVEGDSAGGCFDGDTLVALADGRSLSFRDMVAEQAQGKEHFCYTIRHDGKLGLERAINARVTKTNAEVVRVTLDNGEAIVCTPDHRFMRRDGSYTTAAELSEGDSLMPLYRKVSDMADAGITIDGYEMVWDPRSDRWLFTHVLADWYNRWQGVYAEADGAHCHHRDFNKRNNNPPNIQRLPAEQHLALHRLHVGQTLHRLDVIEKCRAIKQSGGFRAQMSARMQQPETRQLLSEQAKAQWRDKTYKAFMLEKWREFYDSHPAYRALNAEQLDQAQQQYWADETHRQAQSERVTAYFAEHPEVREAFSIAAKNQWQDGSLREWRSGKTREQWTPEFRAKRRAALDQTYYRKSMAALKPFSINTAKVDVVGYSAHRQATRDKSLLRFDTLCRRYFDGDTARACEAVANYNHHVVSVERLDERVDVYDLEVPGTHNFALASGVFVHNSAKQGRDRRYQAILPLRGKIINTSKAALDKTLENNEVRSLITALGIGIKVDSDGDDEGEATSKFDMSKLRYDRIIIMTDADVDGDHIRTLLLTFFFSYMQPLIEQGHVYIAQPPLYSIKSGKDTRLYARSEEERDRMVKELKRKDVQVGRFKGLGEMNAQELFETTLNIETRTLARVTLEDAEAAAEMFSILMSEKVEPRKQFIIKYAREVQNVDWHC
jgi:DNA gyrase subunit B